MEIESIEAKILEIPLKERFEISRGATEMHRSVIVRIESEGIRGWGEASPSISVTGETTESIMAFISYVKERLIGMEINDILKMQRELDKIPHNASAKAGITMAIYDAVSKASGLPLRSYLGGEGNSKETDITIGIMPTDEAVKKAIQYVNSGFKAVKIKVGRNAEDDAVRVKMVSDAVSDLKIRVDANQGYNLQQAIEFSRMIENIEIEFLEQPVRSIEKMAELRRNTSIPLMADESIKDIEDLIRIREVGAADMVNIKIMKVGGIVKAMEIASLAKHFDMGIMVGCMDETSVGIAAGVNFSIAIDAEYTDLDSHLNLSFDPVHNPVRTVNGRNLLDNLPGLGVGDAL